MYIISNIFLRFYQNKIIICEGKYLNNGCYFLKYAVIIVTLQFHFILHITCVLVDEFRNNKYERTGRAHQSKQVTCTKNAVSKKALTI